MSCPSQRSDGGKRKSAASGTGATRGAAGTWAETAVTTTRAAHARIVIAASFPLIACPLTTFVRGRIDRSENRGAAETRRAFWVFSSASPRLRGVSSDCAHHRKRRAKLEIELHAEPHEPRVHHGRGVEPA